MIWLNNFIFAYGLISLTAAALLVLWAVINAALDALTRWWKIRGIQRELQDARFAAEERELDRLDRQQRRWHKQYRDAMEHRSQQRRIH